MARGSQGYPKKILLLEWLGTLIPSAGIWDENQAHLTHCTCNLNTYVDQTTKYFYQRLSIKSCETKTLDNSQLKGKIQKGNFGDLAATTICNKENM